MGSKPGVSVSSYIKLMFTGHERIMRRESTIGKTIGRKGCKYPPPVVRDERTVTSEVEDRRRLGRPKGPRWRRGMVGLRKH